RIRRLRRLVSSVAHSLRFPFTTCLDLGNFVLSGDLARAHVERRQTVETLADSWVWNPVSMELAVDIPLKADCSHFLHITRPRPERNSVEHMQDCLFVIGNRRGRAKR